MLNGKLLRFKKSASALGLSPIFQCSACRIVYHYSTSLSSQSSPTSTQPIRFDYRIGASFSAKNRRFNPQQNAFSFDPAGSEKAITTGRPASGQDAFFSSEIGASSHVAFGVTDGVGGWANSGIDSAYFSHGLCRNMANSARDADDPPGKFTVRELLQRGYDRVVADQFILGGGSTACVAVARNSGNVEVANLGDSGFVQLRLNAVHYYSNPQTHAFNTPYQLSIIPPRILALTRIFGGMPLRDYPRDAIITTHQARHGDVFVFATDGVWDNLTSLDLLKIVSRQMKAVQAWELGENGVHVGDALSSLTQQHSNAKIQEADPPLQTKLAIAITAEAKSASLNSKVDGPFAREMRKRFPYENYRGGKMDDICVVVAIVVKGNTPEK